MPVIVKICVIRPSSPDVSPFDQEGLFFVSLVRMVYGAPFVSHALQRLIQKYEEMRRAGPGGVQFVYGCCKDEEDVNRIVYESLFAYYLLRALETTGDEYFLAGKFEESYESYKLTFDYNRERFGVNSPVTREVKMKIVKCLFDWGQFERIVWEFREDASSEAYGDPDTAKATLYVRYAFAFALIRTDKSLEAISFLCQPYFGVMNLEDDFHMNILELTLNLVLDELSHGNVDFGMRTYRTVASVMEPRFHRRDCPVQYIEFCASFAHILRRDTHVGHFLEVYHAAAGFHLSFQTLESRLWMAVIGCSFPRGTEPHKSCIKDVIWIHQILESYASSQSAFTIRNLEATTKFVYIWADKKLALQILRDTYKKVKAILKRGHPLIDFCLKAIEERKTTQPRKKM